MKENRARLTGTKVDYAVGTVLWWNGREIEVVRDSFGVHPCAKCVLRNSRACHFAVECCSQKRKDGTGVHFENVRKEERI